MTPRTSRAKRLRDIADRIRLSREPTAPGIEPQTVRAILQREADKTIRGDGPDMAHDGIFGDGHLQKELFG